MAPKLAYRKMNFASDGGVLVEVWVATGASSDAGTSVSSASGPAVEEGSTTAAEEGSLTETAEVTSVGLERTSVTDPGTGAKEGRGAPAGRAEEVSATTSSASAEAFTAEGLEAPALGVLVATGSETTAEALVAEPEPDPEPLPNIGVFRGDGSAKLLALAVDSLELGTSELSLAAHSLELADRVGDLLPGDKSSGGVEGSSVGVGTVVGTVSNPVDLAVTILSTDLRGGLLTNKGLLVGEESNGNVAVVGAVCSMGVAFAHPVVKSKGTVRTTHTAHRLVAGTVDDMLVGYLYTVVAHALGLGVHPDSALILGAKRSKRRFIGSFEGNTSVVGAAPRRRCALYLLDFTGRGGIVASLFREDKIAVDIGRSKSIAREARTAKKGSEGLLTIGVLVDNGERVLGLSGYNLVGQKSETVIVCNKTAGFFTALESNWGTNSSESLGVNTLDVNACAAGVEVGQESSLAIRIERTAQSEGIDVVFERGRSELSSSQRQAGGEGKKTRHGDFDLYELVAKHLETGRRAVEKLNKPSQSRDGYE
ncbi:hypothetical protein HG530_004161 [Fusarium avenaceum]|nr:hypothetical protein HG530_004161 [Fusarium avenaceum]